MPETTITEALAELVTLQKRINKKQEFVKQYLFYQNTMRDPLEKEGGSHQNINQELQAIKDLQERIVNIRAAINKKNQEVELTISGVTRTIADWIIWRRDVAPSEQNFLNRLSNNISQVRNQARQEGLRAVSVPEEADRKDIIVNIDEKKLSEKQEHLEEILGYLDGQLSLLNATTTIEV